MKYYVIDTSSLVNLARYYRPFDGNNSLYDRIEYEFGRNNIILLDAVQKEIELIGRGKFIEALPIPDGYKAQKKIDVTYPRLHTTIDNDWTVPREKRRLNPNEYEYRKGEMISGADFQLILYARQNKDYFTVVTEESRSTNDSKTFKKIPLICDHEQIKCITLPDMLAELGLVIDYKWQQL